MRGKALPDFASLICFFTCLTFVSSPFSAIYVTMEENVLVRPRRRAHSITYSNPHAMRRFARPNTRKEVRVSDLDVGPDLPHSDVTVAVTSV
jgi:hypothetical protein